MYASTQSTLQILWLLLLVVFVSGDGISNTVSWADSKYQEVGPVTEYLPDASADDPLVHTCLPLKDAGNLLSVVLNSTERLAPVSGSDAYPSSILHGPPVKNSPA